MDHLSYLHLRDEVKKGSVDSINALPSRSECGSIGSFVEVECEVSNSTRHYRDSSTSSSEKQCGSRPSSVKSYHSGTCNFDRNSPLTLAVGAKSLEQDMVFTYPSPSAGESQSRIKKSSSAHIYPLPSSFSSCNSSPHYHVASIDRKTTPRKNETNQFNQTYKQRSRSSSGTASTPMAIPINFNDFNEATSNSNGNISSLSSSSSVYPVNKQKASHKLSNNSVRDHVSVGRCDECSVNSFGGSKSNSHRSLNNYHSAVASSIKEQPEPQLSRNLKGQHQHNHNKRNSMSPSPSQNLYPILDNLRLNIEEDQTVTKDFESSPSSHKNASSKSQHCTSPTRPKFFDLSMLKSVNTNNQNMKLQNSHHNSSNSSSSNSPSHGSSSQMRLTSKESSRRDMAQAFKSQPIISNKKQDLWRLPKSSSDLDKMRNKEHRLEPENMKTKLLSAWNNLKYGWTLKTKPSMKYDTPLYLLGKCYHKRREDEASAEDEEQEFVKHFFSRIWLTYRSNFYPIPGTRLSSDCGWGCMLRSGQMLVAQCLVHHFLGPDWRLHNQQTREEQVYHREIIRWLSDPVDEGPSDKSPFCLHHLAHFGRQHKKEPGEWYGPSSVAFIFRDAFEKACQSLPILNQVCLYVAQDCTVYIDDILEMCTGRSHSESVSGSHDLSQGPSHGVDGAKTTEDLRSKPWQRALIIFIPMRLGGEVLNEIYIPCVKKLLSQQNCMGIIGGKPKHSLYFLGFQEDKLIYLDPHYCRDAVDTRQKDFKIETYHCMSPRRLQIAKMDPSCTVGFYIKNETEFWSFIDVIKEVATPHHENATYPMFIFSEGSHKNAHAGDLEDVSVEKGTVKVMHYVIGENGERMRAFSQESEDFIML